MTKQTEKIYAEIGLGNDTFLSTEFEQGEDEHRLPKFVKPSNISGYYIRIWTFKKVFIFSTNDGFKTRVKDENKFKILFGISGTS